MNRLRLATINQGLIVALSRSVTDNSIHLIYSLADPTPIGLEEIGIGIGPIKQSIAGKDSKEMFRLPSEFMRSEFQQRMPFVPFVFSYTGNAPKTELLEKTIQQDSKQERSGSLIANTSDGMLETDFLEVENLSVFIRDKGFSS